MDPISLAASVITVIGAATQTHKALLALYSLRNAPHDILELVNEVSELQALLCLVQKATGNVSSSILAPKEQEFIKRLLESATEPLDQLDSLVKICSRNTDADAAKRGARLSISFTAWLRSRNSIEEIRKKLSRAHHNISTALAALSNINQQEDNRLILNIHELVLNQAKENEAQTSTGENELTLYRQFSRAVVEWLNGTVSQSDDAIVSHRRPSTAAEPDKLNVPLSIKPRETRWLVSQKEASVLNGHSVNQNLVEAFASIRTLFYSHTGMPFLCRRPCNYSACIQQETASCQFTYHFPRWLMKKAFMFTASYRDLGGMSASWSIGLPRTISASHIAWQYIECHQSHEFLQLLRQRSISGNDMADDDGISLLIYALKFRSHEIVGLLCNYGANPHFVDPRGISAYAYAQSIRLIDRHSQRPSWSAQMDLAVDKPSVTDDLLFTPLHHVVIGLEQADLHQQLRINKIHINTPDNFGRSPLHWAAIMGNSAAVEALLEHGACPTFVDREQMTPLHDIFLAPPSSQSHCGRLLLSKGAGVDALDVWGRTPLRIAVGYAGISLDFLNLLIDKGADVNRRDVYSQSPLLKSIQGRKETTQLLLSHGADIEARDDYGNTPVLEAIYRNKPEQLQMLLKHGAKTNECFELKPGRRARDGRTHLLDFIIWYGSVEIMRILEYSAKQHYHLSHSLDTLEQYRDFRQANGRKTGVQEHDAFIRMLSNIEFSHDAHLRSNSVEIEVDDDEDECENDYFLDAHDYILEEEGLTA